MIPLPRLLLGLCLVATAAAADPPAAPISVVPAALKEEGVVTFDGRTASSGGANLTLAITVTATEGATLLETGIPTVDRITLDDGRVLDHPAPGRGQQPWSGGGARMGRGRQMLQHPQIALPAAVRGAKAIKALEGALPCTWASGLRRATLAPLRDHLGKRIRISDVPGEPTITVTRTGDQFSLVIDNEASQSVAEYAFVDAAGAEIKPSTSGMTAMDGTSQTWSWTIANAPDDLAMRIDCWREIRRERCPFTLADVRLFEPAARPADDF